LRLNGWQRIGVIASVLWAIGGAFWGNNIRLREGDWVLEEYRACLHAPHSVALVSLDTNGFQPDVARLPHFASYYSYRRKLGTLHRYPVARQPDLRLVAPVLRSKTRVCKLPEEKFNFLGYTFGRCYSPKTGRAYLGTTPSKNRTGLPVQT
jgi:hypothetical protein